MTMLTTMDRRVESIIGDGNCLYCALALIVFGDEMCYEKIRKWLANFISQNRQHFQPYVDGNMVSYIAKVRQTRVWGTAVKLLAAASLFDIPIFTLVPNGLLITGYVMSP